MSQSQFDSLEEETRQSYLERQLWIKDNYEVDSAHIISHFPHFAFNESHTD